jgi:hypothetical protein
MKRLAILSANRKDKDKKIYINELLFVLSIYYHCIIRIPMYSLSEIQSIINIGFMLILLLLSFLFNKGKDENKYISLRFVIILLIILGIYNLSFAFSYNSAILENFKDFIVHGAIPMYLFTKTNNYEKIFKYMAIMSCILLMVYILEPFNNYIYFGGYMGYGLFLILPCFVFIHIYRKYFNCNRMIFFEIVAFFEAVFCSNRGTLLCSIILVIMLDLIFKKKSFKKIIEYILIGILIYVVSCNLYEIIKCIYYFIEDTFGYHSYSIWTIMKTLSGDTNGLAHRDEIWSAALNFYQLHPIFGSGISSFENSYGIYTHNIFLEILTSFGIVGMVIFIIYLLSKIIGFIKFKSTNVSKKMLYLVILIIGIVPLFFSIYMAKWPFFWILLIISNKDKGYL